jgi:hypothetical protein
MHSQAGPVNEKCSAMFRRFCDYAVKYVISSQARFIFENPAIASAILKITKCGQASRKLVSIQTGVGVLVKDRCNVKNCETE